MPQAGRKIGGFAVKPEWVMGSIIALFGTIVSGLLSILVTLVLSMSRKLDNKQDKEECGRRDQRWCEIVKDIWESLGKHSHEGLPPGSKVTR